jgi:hypothetical protein
MKHYGKMQKINVCAKRVIIGDRILGVQGFEPFELTDGEILEVLREDEYRRFYIKLQNKEFWIWAKILDQISKEI